MVRTQSVNAAATLPLGESGPKGQERVMRFANNLPSCTTTAPPGRYRVRPPHREVKDDDLVKVRDNSE